MAVSTRRSSSGSASGGGSGRCSGRRGLTRRTSSTRSEGGLPGGHGHRAAGGRHHGGEVPPGRELGPRAGRRPLAEQRHRPRLAGVEAPAGQRPATAPVPADRPSHGPEHGGRGIGLGPERRVVLAAAGQDGKLSRWRPSSSITVSTSPGSSSTAGDGAGVHAVPLQARVGGQQPRQDQARALRGRRILGRSRALAGYRHREITARSAPWPRLRPPGRAASRPGRACPWRRASWSRWRWPAR